MPSNKEIEFILTLKDNLTARWNSTAAHIKNSAKDLALTFQKYWASITAGWLAVSQLVSTGIDWAKGWIEQEEAANNFRRMVVDAGGDVAAVFERINAAAAGLVDDGDLYKAANYAMQMGLSYKDLPKLMEIARAKAREMGLTVTESWEKMMEAIGAGRERGLKAIGINADVKAAQEAYAEALGKTTTELTKLEEQQALVNAVIEAGEVSLSRQNMGMLTFSERIQALSAQWENVKDTVGQVIVPLGEAVYGLMLGLVTAAEHMARVFLYPFARIQEWLNATGANTGTALIDAEKRLLEMRGKNLEDLGKLFKGIGDATKRQELEAGIGMGWYGKEKEEEIKKTVTAVKELAVAVGDVQRMAAPDETGLRGNLHGAGSLWEIDEYEFARITDQQMQIGMGWDAIINGAQRGVEALSMGIMEGVGEAWESTFGEANSLFEKFMESVMAGIMEVLAFSAAKAVVGSVFSALGLGWLPGLIGLSGSGSGSASAEDRVVDAIEKMAAAPITGVVDVSNGRMMLRRDMPDYEAWRVKKAAGEE